MEPKAAYDELTAHMREIALLNTTLGVLGWDQETGMPASNAAHRGDQMALLSGLVHERFTSGKVGNLLDAAAKAPGLADDPDGDMAVNLREWRRDVEKARRIPQDLVEDMARATSEAQVAWVEARSKKAFALFQPHLEIILGLVRRQADCLGWKDHPYDALLDEYEPGLTTAMLDALFPPLLDRLTDLSRRIQSSPRKPDSSILHRPVEVEAQKAFGRLLAEAIGFDFSRGRLDVSAHPFTTSLGPSDVRITTRYDEKDFSNSLFSTLHEAGHGIYDQGLPRGPLFGTPRGEATSLGIHESQSRLWENLVGRSAGFWRRFYPILRECTGGAFDGVSEPDFVFAVNRSAPSLIRTEADEVTYNLHVGLRYELEKNLLTGDLKVSEVPEAWRASMKVRLGVEPPDDASGCLQDVHWSHGSFGYFPTYTLGNLYSAQLYMAAGRELGDLEGAFARGDFAPLKGWLNNHIHIHGRRFQSAELCRRASGSDLSPEPFLSYLESKFGALYGF